MTKDEALKLALKALVESKEHFAKHRRLEAITAIKEALAQPAVTESHKQETVAWGMEQSDGEILDVITPEEHARLEGGYTVPLYRHPQRTWVGLTDEEVMELAFNFDVPSLIVRTVEAKLKEKNT